MTIYARSRYNGSKVQQLDTVHGLRNTIVSGEQDEFVINYETHTVLGSERIDLIAQLYYGDPESWWKISDANPEILDWGNVAPGTLIRIPNV